LDRKLLEETNGVLKKKIRKAVERRRDVFLAA
jgi:hypothetical protein